MKILSRYLIYRFLGYVGLTTLAFFGLVLATRFHEVARFASLGAPLEQIGLLLLLQFPYVLPFVLPVSMLLAAFLLMRKASERFELVSLRASGFSLFQIQRPILLTALCFSVLNFWLVSDVATFCHQKARFLEREFREINPLVFLKKPELLGIKGLEVMNLGEIDPGRSSTRSIIAIPDFKKGRISLLLADALVRDGLDVIGHDVLFLTSMKSKTEIPDIFIDKAEEMRLNGENFFSAFKKEGGKISVDFLPTPLLIQRTIETGFKPQMVSEIVRRFSMTLEPLTLTLIGLSFGIFFGRHKSLSTVFLMFVLVSINLVSIFLGKSFDRSMTATFLIYLVPHPLLWICSWFRLRQLNLGAI
jgi:Predicted permeases